MQKIADFLGKAKDLPGEMASSIQKFGFFLQKSVFLARRVPSRLSSKKAHAAHFFCASASSD
jgi:hypothetical protein